MSEYQTFGFLGTSIGQGYFDETGKGWVVRLFEKLNEDKPAFYYLSNMARSGDKSYDLSYRFYSEAMQRGLDHIIIEVPCNDVGRRGSAEEQTDLSEFVQMRLWDDMIPAAKKNFENIYVVSSAPMNERTMAQTRRSDWNVWYKNDDIIGYNGRVKALCDDHSIPFVNLYSELDNVAYLDTLDDSVHPNTQGHMMIADVAYNKFKQLGL